MKALPALVLFAAPASASAPESDAPQEIGDAKDEDNTALAVVAVAVGAIELTLLGASAYSAAADHRLGLPWAIVQIVPNAQVTGIFFPLMMVHTTPLSAALYGIANHLTIYGTGSLWLKEADSPRGLYAASWAAGMNLALIPSAIEYAGSALPTEAAQAAVYWSPIPIAIAASRVATRDRPGFPWAEAVYGGVGLVTLAYGVYSLLNPRGPDAPPPREVDVDLSFVPDGQGRYWLSAAGRF